MTQNSAENKVPGNKFAEGPGFNSLPVSMVIALPIIATTFSLAKDWLFNSNIKGDTTNNKSYQKDIDMNKENNSKELRINNRTLETAIGAVLRVGYDTTIEMGAGALLQTPQANAQRVPLHCPDEKPRLVRGFF